MTLNFTSVRDLNQFLNEAGKLCGSDTKGYFKIKGNSPPKVIAYKSYEELAFLELVWQNSQIGSAIRKGSYGLLSSDREVIDLTDSFTKLNNRGASLARLINQKMKAPLFIIPRIVEENVSNSTNDQPSMTLIDRKDSLGKHSTLRCRKRVKKSTNS